MKIRTYYARAGVLAAGASQILAGRALAAVGDDSSINPGGSSDFSSETSGFKEMFTGTANTILSVITLVAGVLAVFYLIWSGIQYITSTGNPEKAKSARQGIINAVIGIIIIVAAYFIIRLAISGGNTLVNSQDNL